MTITQEIVNGSQEVKWEDRDPTTYWKGNANVAAARREPKFAELRWMLAVVVMIVLIYFPDASRNAILFSEATGQSFLFWWYY